MKLVYTVILCSLNFPFAYNINIKFTAPSAPCINICIKSEDVQPFVLIICLACIAHPRLYCAFSLVLSNLTCFAHAHLYCTQFIQGSLGKILIKTFTDSVTLLFNLGVWSVMRYFNSGHRMSNDISFAKLGLAFSVPLKSPRIYFQTQTPSNTNAINVRDVKARRNDGK